MAIEFKCQGCQKTLRVPDKFAGRKARCPNCQTILQVAAAESETVEPLEVQPPIASTPNPFADPVSSDSPSSYGQSSAPNPYGTSNPYSSPQPQPQQPGYRHSSGSPHRGGLVLGFGIAAIVTCNFCFIFGSLSLAFGLIDLRAMREGRMDKSGHGLTLAGTIMGGVMTGISLVFISLRILVVALQIFAG